MRKAGGETGRLNVSPDFAVDDVAYDRACDSELFTQRQLRSPLRIEFTNLFDICGREFRPPGFRASCRPSLRCTIFVVVARRAFEEMTPPYTGTIVATVQSTRIRPATTLQEERNTMGQLCDSLTQVENSIVACGIDRGCPLPASGFHVGHGRAVLVDLVPKSLFDVH